MSDLLAVLNAHDIIRAKTGINYPPDITLWYGVDDDDRAIADAQARATLRAAAAWLRERAKETMDLVAGDPANPVMTAIRVARLGAKAEVLEEAADDLERAAEEGR